MEEKVDISGIYETLIRLAEENLISQPFLVGGTPRDIYRGSSYEYNDLDFTTNDSGVVRLALLCADSLNSFFKVFEDGHISLYLSGHNLDFSSNFISKKAMEHLGSTATNSPLLREVYSRDFTINTLHMSISDMKITDPLNSAKDDIDNKIIRTPIPAEITLTDDVKRIFRSIEFATRLGFDIDDDIINFAKLHGDFIRNNKDLKRSFVEGIIGRSIGNDPQKTIELLSEMKILDIVPLSGLFKEELIKRRMIKQYLDLSS